MEIELERRRKIKLRSVELEKAFKKPKATEYELRQLERAGETKVKLQKDEEVVTTERQYISVHSQLRHTEPSMAAQPVYVKQVTMEMAKPTEDSAKVAEQQITLERGQPPVFTKPLRPVRVPEGSGIT
ncbi:MAG: hypothetical protein KAG66_05460 [Methylococcales bacterium]|nr:hypothetical protein [Methylococcales bacterium]